MNPPRRTSRRERAPSPHPSAIPEPHRCSTADSCRTLSTIFGSAPMTVSTSSAALSFPNEKRSAATPSSRGTPIAVSTCDGSTAPVLQAEPDEQAMPARSRCMSRASESVPRSEEHTSELQSLAYLVCRLLLEKKKKKRKKNRVV